MGDQVFPTPDTLSIILNCNVNRQAAPLQSPPGSCCTSSLCRTHSICRWTWCCRQRPGTRAALPGRKQPILLPTSHSIFSLCCFFSHSFSRHPQLNFLIRCLSSLFAHSQHPPGPPLLPLFFITPFPKSLETFLSYQVIVFFSEIRNCGLAIDTFYEYQTKDAYHGKLYKTEFDITTLNTRKSPSRVRHSSCSHKVKAHKAQPQPLLQLRSLRGVWRDLVVIFSLGNCHHFTISL